MEQAIKPYLKKIYISPYPSLIFHNISCLNLFESTLHIYFSFHFCVLNPTPNPFSLNLLISFGEHENKTLFSRVLFHPKVKALFKIFVINITD